MGSGPFVLSEIPLAKLISYLIRQAGSQEYCQYKWHIIRSFWQASLRPSGMRRSNEEEPLRNFRGFARMSCVALMGLMLAACATQEVSEMVDYDYYRRPSLEDELLAIGMVRVVSEDADSGDAKKAFLGRKNTYLLTQGGGEIFALAESPLAPHLAIAAPKNDYSKRLHLFRGRFWGELTLVVRNGERYSPEHDAELAKFGFVDGKKTIQIEGFTASPAKLPEAVATKLTTSRPISFFPSSDHESPPVSLKQKLLYPPAVAVDLVTSPLQLIVIGAFIVVIEANGGLQVIR